MFSQEIEFVEIGWKENREKKGIESFSTANSTEKRVKRGKEGTEIYWSFQRLSIASQTQLYRRNYTKYFQRFKLLRNFSRSKGLLLSN